jgi:hypothetical protein
MKGTTFEQQGTRQAVRSIPSKSVGHNFADFLHCPGHAMPLPPLHSYLSSTLPPLDRKLLLLTYKCLCRFSDRQLYVRRKP